MSHATYQAKWTECMQELMEQVQIEYLPAEANDNGQSFQPGFQHFALLYIKYLQIYKKLEDCHNQIVHPQKRRDIWRVLRSTIYRILELKQELITFNPRTNSRFIALDEVLTDLKLNPETVEWAVPRYFLDDQEAREEIAEKDSKLDHWLGVFNMPAEPHALLDPKDPFEVGLTVDQAVAIIQKNERGRMGINRADMVCTWRKDSVRKEERQRRQAEKGGDGQDDFQESQVLAATRIAAHWKRKVDRRRFLRMREEEFEFLGMAPLRHDPKAQIIEDMKKHRERRKKMQEDADEVYQKALKEQLEWLQKKKGADIKADLLEERRQWILDCYQRYDKQLKFPAEFDEFYKQFDPDEEEPAADPKGKGKDAKGKDDKAKKGKGGKKDADEEGEPHDAGPRAVVQQFVEHINQYTEKWENRDESNNFDQRHDIELARKNVYPIVETELRQLVDDQMREELANLKLLFDQSKKGKQPKPKKAKASKPKAPKKWCSAVGTITNKADCVPDLIDQGVLKKVKPVHLQDFAGEYHYLGAMLRSHHKFWGEYHFPPPSAQMIRSLLVEHCILPLAQTDIRQKAPENLTARSLLLYGPKGTGKSMLARAIATECGASFFDLSPSVIEGKSTQGGAKGADLLVFKTLTCAQDLAPSVIYIDQVEQVYQAVKKGKKGGDPNAPVRIKKVLSAAIKQVKVGTDATEQDRVLFIGCTSRPFDDNVDKKELLAAFEVKVWVSYPEYGSRVMLWQKFMEAHGVFVDPTKLNISTLARVSDGYSAGSIKQTVDRVLTARRVQQLKVRPLKVQEFIGPLSRTSFCWREEYQQFSDFDFEATGEKALHESRAAAEKAAEEAAAKGKGR
mmetsp:Transcript_44441/g.95827  ORF Transcript_44441/g.95827 Transcript_44441/m.95827 type:complete len:850 (-) Transcript_44441:163-2712(-)|eukprot:CAMPEP_0206546174 /NCGR_PEP_ID=MMETSP0325_2-20121206/12551_1 /ASSEMBLY_ACC=CAM_ASM_000347 /TAXON_ID=2866 /ORGANISM="Crypthecodinium cohnii, Strain Seligo" /LENGTH=849 /DNA_ID=CAMNT_0054045253 /DNA_START=34 /DNA_END=2583 /DNA_ORIENTATION=-